MSGRSLLGVMGKLLGRNRRRAQRYSVLLTGRVISGSGATPVTIHDLSVTGARVHAADLPAVGATVILKRAALELAATVAWKDGPRAGLQFARPMPEERLFGIVHAPRGQKGTAAAPSALAA